MDGRLRASDAERETYAEKVRKAVGEGRLTMSEGDERMRTVYATLYRDELAPLVADLPPDPQPPQSRREQPDWPGYRGPHPAHYWAARGFRPTFPAGPLAVAAILIGLWALSGAHFFWPAIPLFFLGLFFFRRLWWWRASSTWQRRADR
jgi:hypothetical protein